MIIPISDLRIHPENKNIYGEESVDELAQSIEQSGYVKPIVINQDNIIVSGHRRIKACVQLGYDAVPSERIETKDEWHLLELLLLENKFRHKTNIQKLREAEKWEVIEREKAKKRFGGRHKSTTDNCPELHEGETRDAVAAQVNLGSGKSYERGKKVKGVLEDYLNQGKIKEAELLEAALNRSINGALKLSNLDLSGLDQHVTEKLKNDELSVDKIHRELVDRDEQKKPHVAQNSSENEWYTPGEYIELARSVLGQIDLDPASCEFANKTVKALKYYSKGQNGLDEKWYGNVWVNPPYSSSLIKAFSDKIVAESGNFKQCIILINNATETRWFQQLASKCNAIAFPRGRIKYYRKNGFESTPLQGQALLYFGERANEFRQAFQRIGITLAHE